LTDRDWIPFATAVAILFDGDNRKATERLQRVLMRGEVKSRGIPARDGIEPADIDADRWGVWWFNVVRESLDPPSKSRIATGFTNVRISRADVERLADRLVAQTKSEPPVDLRAVLTDARAVNPKLTGAQAFEIAREAGSNANREEIRAVLKSIGGSRAG
jgi:hypothetical protein